MENTNRSVFLGVGGMLVTTVILLTILAVLTMFGIKAQQDVMQKPYILKDAQNVQMIGSKANDHIIIKETR